MDKAQIVELTEVVAEVFRVDHNFGSHRAFVMIHEVGFSL